MLHCITAQGTERALLVRCMIRPAGRSCFPPFLPWMLLVLGESSARGGGVASASSGRLCPLPIAHWAAGIPRGVMRRGRGPPRESGKGHGTRSGNREQGSRGSSIVVVTHVPRGRTSAPPRMPHPHGRPNFIRAHAGHVTHPTFLRPPFPLPCLRSTQHATAFVRRLSPRASWNAKIS